MKNYLLFVFASLFFVINTLNAQELPPNEGDIQQWEKIMLEYAKNDNNFSDKNRSEVKKIIIEFDKTLSIYPERPRLWIVLGHLYSREIMPILNKLKKLGMPREERGKNVEYLEAIKNVNESFKKALELNTGVLTINDLMYIDTVITKADINIASFKEMLRLYGEGKDFVNPDGSPDTNFEYKTYAKIVGAYIDEKRYEEALSVIDEIEKKFPYMQSEIDLGRKDIAGYIQAESETTQQEQEDATQETETKKTEAVTTTDKQQPDVKTEDALQNHKDSVEADNNKAIIIGIVLTVLLLIGFAAVKRKK